MNTHIKKSDILKYVSCLLPVETIGAIESHISTCPECLLKVSHGYAKKKEACNKAEELFADYLEGELQPDEMTFVNNHLLICYACEQKYHKLVEEKEEKTLETELNLKTFDVSAYNLPNNSLGESEDAESEKKRIEINKKDTTAADQSKS
ncbi:MAG: zf-HC2 domain-containing protein [Nitrospirae bacterium]|nr:zf-HC2 domain-containing protein [Nitrospirota bacterium]